MALYGVAKSERYREITSNEMISRGLDAKISSCNVFGSSTADMALILFGDQPSSVFWPAPPAPDYSINFLQLTNSTATQQISNLSAFNFNNRAQSGLLVATARRREIRVSFRDLFLDIWKKTLDGILSEAKRLGDPVLTWEMFPKGISFLSPNRIYLKAFQRLEIEIPWWPDYEAWIQYHIFLFIDSSGNLKGAVHRWSYWIESGAKTDDVAERLRPAVINGMGTLDEILAGELSAFDESELRDIYYLPGRQLSPVTAVSGVTTEDVTIVIEH